MPATRVVKLGGFFIRGAISEDEVGAHLPTLTFDLMVLVKSRPSDVKAQISKIGSTRSAIGRIVTAYRMVQTVRSALEGKAHLTLPERGRCTGYSAAFHFLPSPVFRGVQKYVISPQSMMDNELQRLGYEILHLSEYAGSEDGRRTDSRGICQDQRHEVSTTDLQRLGLGVDGGKGVLGHDRGRVMVMCGFDFGLMRRVFVFALLCLFPRIHTVTGSLPRL